MVRAPGARHYAHEISRRVEDMPSFGCAGAVSYNQLRFVNHGVEGDTASLQSHGDSWLGLPTFRAPKVDGGFVRRGNDQLHPANK